MQFRLHNIVFFCLLLNAYASPTLSAENTRTIKAQTVFHTVALPFTDSQGLSQNTVLDIAQDEFSRYWVATQDGLNLINANQVTVIKPSKDGSGLSSTVIQRIIADHQGALWTLTQRGLDRVDIHDLSVRHFGHLFTQSNSITAMDLISDRQLILLVDGQLMSFDIKTAQLHNISPSAERINAMASSDHGVVLWQANKFIYFSPKTGATSPFPFIETSNVQVWKFSYSTDGYLWISTYTQGVLRCDLSTCTKVVFDAGNGETVMLDRVLNIKNKNVAITDHGLFIFDHLLEQVQLVITDDNSHLFRRRLNNQELLIADDGAILVGAQNGLYYLSGNYPHIASFLSSNGVYQQQFLAAASIAAGHKQKLVLAGEKHLLILDEHQGALTKSAQFSYPEGFDPVHFIQSGQHAYLSSFFAGTLKITPTGFTPLSEQMPDLPEPNKILIDLMTLENNSLLLLYQDELLLMAPQGHSYITQWRHALPTQQSFKGLYRNGTIYIAARDGLLVTTLVNNQPQEWHKLLEDEIILDIKAGTDQQTLAFTAESGIFSIDKQQKYWYALSAIDNNKLLNNTTLCGVPLLDGRWLVATNNGVVTFDHQLKLQHLLTEYDGLATKEYEQFGCGKINGKAYVQGRNGISIFHDPLARKFSLSTPKMNWVGIWADGKKIPATNGSGKMISPALVSISFAIGPLPLRANANFQYRFLSDPMVWHNTNHSQINFAHLAVGQYELQVRAKLYNGRYTLPINTRFRIAPLWWRSDVAMIFYIMIILTIFYLLFRHRWLVQRARLELVQLQKQHQEDYNKVLAQQVQQRTLQLQLKQQEALRLHQEKSKFITEASHDLKHLCALIQLNVKNLQLNKQQTNTTKTKAAIIAATDTLGILVSDVVELSKLDAEVIIPDMTNFALASLIEPIIHQYTMTCQTKHLKLQLHCDDAIQVYSDRHLLTRILLNLVDNAIKNLRTGERLLLSVAKVEDKINITIRDTGPGMSADLVYHWQEPFLRGSNDYIGSGLGLSIVARVAQLLAIPIKLTSQEGEGTTFCLQLPAATEKVKQKPVTKVQIAVIEDEVRQRDWLTDKLTNQGHQVDCYVGAKDFLTTSVKEYEVIISDVSLGDEDGIKMLNQYRLHLTATGIIVYISGNHHAKKRLIAEDKVYFLPKPIKFAKLSLLLQRG